MAAILKAGHIPAGMELFTAGDKSQMDTIKRWIDESDAYMLILGGRYGSVEPTSGVSYTELEYDYALEQGKPSFAVVIEDDALNEKVRLNGIGLIERENPKQLRQFREKVLSKVSSFFSNQSDIKLCVHESLADFRDNPELKGWISASEFEDTKPLHDEIAMLRVENEKLKQAVGSRTTETPITTRRPNFVEVIEWLKTTIIKLPEGASLKENSVYNLFVHNSESLINGVTNQVGSNDVDYFFYHNLAPKLMLQGLMANEKVPGVRYRRSFVTQKGLSVLAEIEIQRKKSGDIINEIVETITLPGDQQQVKPKPKPRATRAKKSST